jgi:hypothetical protein
MGGMTNATLTTLRKRIARLAGNVRTGELARTHGMGRNFEATCRSTAVNLEDALRALVAAEDELGVDAVAAQADRITALRQRAVELHMIDAGTVAEAEDRAVA